jgi:hypothetical protein
VQCRLGTWMSKQKCRIGAVALASRMSPEVAERVPTLAKSLYPDRTPEIIFHPQCFASHGHFAGDDETREKLSACTGQNDPDSGGHSHAIRSEMLRQHISNRV